ncbi:MAG: DedA family protein [Candidatus Altiarchaeota archaeon]|nr:DedA family protein [Candidatus Altiarchaeota archaeon]
MIGDVFAVLAELVRDYGLIGLFASALVGSTIFVPLSVEALLPILIRARIDLYLIILVASIGALIGTWINYGIGRYAANLASSRLGNGRVEKAKGVMNKYGWPGLFAVIATPIPLPIPVDPITLIPGITRMDFMKFSLVVFAAKLIRYALFVGILNGLLKIFFP